MRKKANQKSDKKEAESGKALAGNDEKKAKDSKHGKKEVPEGICHSTQLKQLKKNIRQQLFELL